MGGRIGLPTGTSGGIGCLSSGGRSCSVYWPSIEESLIECGGESVSPLISFSKY